MNTLFVLIFTLQLLSSPYTVNIAGNVKNRLYSPDTNVNLGQDQTQKVNLSVEQPSSHHYTEEQPAIQQRIQRQLIPHQYAQQPVIQQYGQEYIRFQPINSLF